MVNHDVAHMKQVHVLFIHLFLQFLDQTRVFFCFLGNYRRTYYCVLRRWTLRIISFYQNKNKLYIKE